MPAISVIIATYNYLNYLKLCLASLERQSFGDFEVIIADDGSGPEVGEWLAAYKPRFQVTHLWQEDQGFRKCLILNQALLCAQGQYLVFVDADCILSKRFLERHWHQREHGCYLGGRRVRIARKTAESITEAMVRGGLFDGISPWALRRTLSGDVSYLEEAFRPLHYLRRDHRFSLLGCNFSIHKDDIFAVNGFDEDYETRGGGEDTDIAARLDAVGYKMKSVRYLAVQYHLGHEKAGDKSASAELFRHKQPHIKDKAAAININSTLARQTQARDSAHAKTPDTQK